MIAMAWAHHCKIYRDKFKEGAPKWLDEMRVYDRLQWIKLATKLNWRLPQDLIPEAAVDITLERKKAPR